MDLALPCQVPSLYWSIVPNAGIPFRSVFIDHAGQIAAWKKVRIFVFGGTETPAILNLSLLLEAGISAVIIRVLNPEFLALFNKSFLIALSAGGYNWNQPVPFKCFPTSSTDVHATVDKEKGTLFFTDIFANDTSAPGHIRLVIPTGAIPKGASYS